MASELAVIQHRIAVLEMIPPRLNTLETEVAGMKSELHLARADIGYVRDQTHDNNKMLAKIGLEMRGLDEKIARLFWTGAGVFITCSVMGGAVALVISILKSGAFS